VESFRECLDSDARLIRGGGSTPSHADRLAGGTKGRWNEFVRVSVKMALSL
jgi:hypothetical protein